MSDAVRRGIRTALWFILAAVPVIPSAAAIFNVDATLVGKVVAFLTLIGSFLTAVINMAEDKGVIPAFLKAQASSGENPVGPVGPAE